MMIDAEKHQIIQTRIMRFAIYMRDLAFASTSDIVPIVTEAAFSTGRNEDGGLDVDRWSSSSSHASSPTCIEGGKASNDQDRSGTYSLLQPLDIPQRREQFHPQ